MVWPGIQGRYWSGRKLRFQRSGQADGVCLRKKNYMAVITGGDNKGQKYEFFRFEQRPYGAPEPGDSGS
jgi:hypothetical protein